MSRRKKGQRVHGWVVLDKPLAMGSTPAVSKVRHLFQAQKAGHAGTLDPLASGILPVALGEATKTVPWLMDAQKVYRFTVRWGVETTTLDGEGEPCAHSDVRPAPQAVQRALAGFLGTISQTPPAYSAIRVDGARAYDLARAGETVMLEPREVVIHEAEVVGANEHQAEIRIRSGKGVYVRSLARDLAHALGTLGHVTQLRREQVGPFTLEDAIGFEALSQLEQAGELEGALLPLHAACESLPELVISEADAADLRLGRSLLVTPSRMEGLRAQLGEDRQCLAMTGDEAVAIGEVRAGRFQPTRVFQP
ncbi:MAG: tRNA pseudouridine(55) synthase TruB [Brevundimonas sp.]|uniref:tRNA pseudouridine(55) synthase TruB n=1 Tax=Brevundimonas sp. TaxID=1871086 RepID=UPI00391D1F43